MTMGTGWKQWVKSLIGALSACTGLHGPLLSGYGIVVAFHRVNNEVPMDDMTCGIEMFERYCHFFAKHFEVTPLGDIVSKLSKGERLSGELAITFDDGYRDNFENAAPILKRMGLPATFFVVSRFIGTDHIPWWDEKEEIRHPWMSWDHVRSLHESGFDIACHTRTHADLGTISGEEAFTEIGTACADLELQLGTKVEHFAFPYGQGHNLSVENRNRVCESGLRCCCSLGGIVGPGDDPFCLPRVPINSWYRSPFHLLGDLVIQAVKRYSQTALKTQGRGGIHEG